MQPVLRDDPEAGGYGIPSFDQLPWPDAPAVMLRLDRHNPIGFDERCRCLALCDRAMAGDQPDRRDEQANRPDDRHG